MKWKPHLRTILLISNMVVLLLPLAGIDILKLYESELVRRTETSLLSQGALLVAAYGKALERELNPDINEEISTEALLQRIARGSDRYDGQGFTDHVPAVLDIADGPIHPKSAAPTFPTVPPDVVAVRAAADVEHLLDAVRTITLAGVRIVDRNGIVVGSTGTGLGMSLVRWPEVRTALNGRHVSYLRERPPEPASHPIASISRRARVRVFVALPVEVHGNVLGAVVLSRTPLDLRKALYINREHLFWGSVIILGVVVLLSIFTSLTISRPVSALIDQSDRVTRGEAGAAVPLETPVTREVDLLSKSFARMARTLEARAYYLRTFASNVSHAFKTPLTSMNGTVELLQDHMETMKPEERDRFLTILKDDTNRLERLVRRLMDLARAEVSRPGDERTNVVEILGNLGKRYGQHGLQIAAAYGWDMPPINMAEETFESIMCNLLDNALQHGADHVDIRVRRAYPPHVTEEALSVTVADNGHGISEANAELVFQPFFTTAGNRGGSGLGLSIVHALVSAHGGSVRLLPTDKGAAFELTIPTA